MLKLTPLFFSSGLKITQFPSYQSVCDDSEDYSDKPASKLFILNWERREPCKNARANGYGQEKGEKCGIVSLFLLLFLLLLSCFPLFFDSAALFPLERFYVRWPAIMTNCKGGLIEPTNCYAIPALVLSLWRTAQGLLWDLKSP